MRIDVPLVFGLLCAVTAPVAACNLDDIDVDFDPLIEELACEFSDTMLVPYEQSSGGFAGGAGEGGLGGTDGVALNGIKASPHAPVPVSSEAEYTLTFLERPNLLEVQASGALEIAHVGSVQCGPNESNAYLPFAVNVLVRSSETVGEASLTVSLAGEEVAAYDLSVARAEDMGAAMFDPTSGQEVTELEAGRDYWFGAAPETGSGDPLYFQGPAELELLSGSAEIQPAPFAGMMFWSVRSVEAGELTVRVRALGLTEDLTFPVADPM